MTTLLKPLALLSLLLSGAIFGFFYAWVCSTMWGLDAADPRVAIEAMQAMNASVRNPVFAPAFFGTPVVLIVTGLIARSAGQTRAGFFLGAAGGLYLAGGLLLTMAVNVPMNRALGEVTVPATRAEAEAIWLAYSPKWQVYNIARTVVSGGALLLCGLGVLSLAEGRGPRSAAA